jgi:hypothetical protein
VSIIGVFSSTSFGLGLGVCNVSLLYSLLLAIEIILCIIILFYFEITPHEYLEILMYHK